MTRKVARQAALIKAIEKQGMETQEELAGVLRQTGFEVTQATLSRDLKELNVAKVRRLKGKLVYATGEAPGPAWPALRRMAVNLISEVKRTGNIVVAKTMPGYASGVAAAVDRLQDQTVLGSVAGDDTIIIIISDDESAVSFAERLAGKGV